MIATHATTAETTLPPEVMLAQSVLSDHLHLRIPSRPELIEKLAMRLVARARETGVCTEERECGLVTSLVEAITNAIVHGNLEIPSSLKEQPGNAFGRLLAERCSDPRYAERMVDIHVDDDGYRCTWTISDQGPGFDVAKHLAKIDSEEPQLELCSGRGILMIRALTDGCSWENGGRTIHFHLNRDKKMQRAHIRQNTLQSIRAVPVDSEGGIDWNKAFDALATNISVGGMGMLSLEKASAHRLLLEVMVDGKATLVPAEVRHVTSVDGQMFQIGCAFPSSPPDPASSEEIEAQKAAIDRLLTANTKLITGQHERRKHPRTIYTKSVGITIGGAPARMAVARDLSRTGIAFIAEFKLEKGEVANLTLEPESQTPLHVKIRIVRGQRMAGRFHDYGAEFML